MHVLFFLHPGTNSRSQFRDMARGFARAGNRVSVCELAPIWQAYERGGPALKPRLMSDFTAQIRRFIESEGVDLTCAMWTNGLTSLANTIHEGAPASLFDLLRRPHLCVWLDAPHWARGGDVPDLLQSAGGPILRSPNLWHFINNAGTARDMERVLGMRNVLPQSYGIDEEVFRPCPDEPRDYDLVYACGPGDPAPTPLMLRELQADDPDVQGIRAEAAQRLLPELLRMAPRWPPESREGAGEVVHALVRSQLQPGGRDVPILGRLEVMWQAGGNVRQAVEVLLTDPRLFVDVTMKVRLIEAYERAFTFAYLSRRFRCLGFGAGELRGWDVRAERVAFVPYEDQARMYSRGRVGLNVMRWQDDVGLNVKPYEITASGAMLLCAHRAGLGELFQLDTAGEDDAEAVEFSTPREAREKLRELLEDPDLLDSIAQRGRARTLRQHTWTAVAGRVTGRILGRAAAGLTCAA